MTIQKVSPNKGFNFQLVNSTGVVFYYSLFLGFARKKSLSSIALKIKCETKIGVSRLDSKIFDRGTHYELMGKRALHFLTVLL